MAQSKVASVSSSASSQTQSQTIPKRLLLELKGYAEALIVAFLIVTFVFNTVGVVGSSMSPNLNGGTGSQNILLSLLQGDRVFIPKYETWLRRAGILGAYQRGDVVVVREPENSPTAQSGERRPFFIKRVVAVAGDRIRIEAGQVIVNDHSINQSFITSTGQIRPDPVDFPVVTQSNFELTGMVIDMLRTPSGEAYPELPFHSQYLNVENLNNPDVQLFYGPTLASLKPIPEDAPENAPFILDLVVPEGHYFVMGDNRQSSKGGSEDSRYFGAIKELSIAGRASAVIWPPQRNGAWNWRSLTPPEAFKDIPTS